MNHLIHIQTIVVIQHISNKRLMCKINKLLFSKIIFIHLKLLQEVQMRT